MTGVRTISLAAGGRELAVRVAPQRDQVFPLFPSVGEYPIYGDTAYDGFDRLDQRVRCYRDAIDDAAGGRIVLDIGTGRDALWAVHAARAGARHVYAIEQQADAAREAARTIAAAGLTDRITVIHGLSTDVSLPEPAQLCVSEIVGNIASAEGAVAALADARRRLCAPDCVWIPFRIQTWAAAVDLSAHSLAFATESLPYLKKVFDAVGNPFDLRLCLGGPAATLPISTAAVVESIVFDHRRLPPEQESTSATELTVDRGDSRMTGLLLWTRVAVTSHMAEVDTLTGDTLGWAPVYAPMSLEGIDTRHGDTLAVTFGRTTSDDGLHPDYRSSVSGPRLTSGSLTWSSRHHSSDFRTAPLHRRLFP